MKMHGKFTVLFVVFCWPAFGTAQPQFEQATIDQLVDYALQNNPGWAATGKMVEQKKAGIEGANGWKNPKIKYSQFIEPIETKRGPQNFQVSVVQPLPFLSETDLKEEKARFETEVAIYSQESAKRRLIRNIKATYYELWQLEQIPRLLEENQRVVERMVSLGSFESQRNSKMLPMIFKAQAAVGANAFELVEMEDRLYDAKTKLDNLLGHPGEHIVGSVAVPQMPVFSALVEDLVGKAIKQNPSLKALAAKQDAALSLEKMRTRENWSPRFEVGLNYFSIGDPSDGSSPQDAGKDSYSISLGMSLPFGSAANQAKQAQATAQREAAQLQRQQKENDLKEAVSKQYNRVKNAQRLVKLFDEQLLPPARRSQKLNERLYSSGTKNMMTALEAKTHLLTLEVRSIKAKANYLKSLVELEELVGVDLSDFSR